mgnify:CR=1 FL=1
MHFLDWEMFVDEICNWIVTSNMAAGYDFWPAQHITYFYLLERYYMLLFLAMHCLTAKLPICHANAECESLCELYWKRCWFFEHRVRFSSDSESEMLKMQERMFKSILESVLSSVNMRIDKVVKSIAELKASLEYSQDMDDLMEAADAIDNMCVWVCFF